MEKISFNQVRGFSDCITYTFNFIKQEIKPLLRSFALIVLPLIFINLFLTTLLLSDSYEAAFNGQDLQVMTDSYKVRLLLNYLSSMVLSFWAGLWGIAYMRAYQDKYNEEERVTPQEVLRVMWRNLGMMLVWGIVYGLSIVVGTFFLVIPGIYLAVVWLFTIYFIVFRERSLTTAMGDSYDLVKGHWWNLFGYVIILVLIGWALSSIFSIPSMVLSVQSMFTQQVPGIFSMSLTLLLATVGQHFLQIIMTVGLGMRFFSFLEEKEHTNLLSKIDEIGADGQA